jgi:hypothetical protein
MDLCVVRMHVLKLMLSSPYIPPSYLWPLVKDRLCFSELECKALLLLLHVVDGDLLVVDLLPRFSQLGSGFGGLGRFEAHWPGD